ncbi:hypothetical protein JVT61DRAFT_9513 [Boletus reticuloceps]|uniref:Uncharacterized protein n=1 Tax=Boletus reticuloceps TaxID=495285 RepID=A0A8I2YGC1_9AGAM|nr:hypothetical protein JVT61DRAFT_9513 [Boletus reticuloceps]
MHVRVLSIQTHIDHLVQNWFYFEFRIQIPHSACSAHLVFGAKQSQTTLRALKKLANRKTHRFLAFTPCPLFVISAIICPFAMKTELELANELLSRLVLCTKAATQLTVMLQRNADLTDISSLLNSTDSPVSSDNESDKAPTRGALKIPHGTLGPVLRNATNAASTLVTLIGTSAPPPAPTPAPTPTLAPTLVLTEDFLSAKRSNKNTGSTVRLVDPTGPHHLFVPGGLSKDGHVQGMYNKFIYDLPPLDAMGRLYLITRGRRVGIFSQWVCTSRYINRVRGAVHMKVNSLDQGIAMMMEAIELKEACWLE